MTTNPGRVGSKNYKNKIFSSFIPKRVCKKKLEIVIEDPDLVFLSGDPSAGYGCFKTIA